MWLSAILALIQALPQILKLIERLTAVNKEREAQKAKQGHDEEWDDFEKKWKTRK